MQIRELLERDPFREIRSVIRVDDHDPERVWLEMGEYVPTETVKRYFRDILDVLLETRRGATERTCLWISGFFGSGKSHFLKALGYLLENRELRDPDGHAHSSSEFLCGRLNLETFLPYLTREFCIRVLFINLLDRDPQNPNRPTISRLIYRDFLQQKGLATEFWVAAWEREFQCLGKWEDFRAWVEQTYNRPWEAERRLHAEVVLKRALPRLLPERYGSEEEAVAAISESKEQYSTITPSQVVEVLHTEARDLHPQNGRIVVLLDEVGLYIGDDVDRLTDLNALAEQIVRRGGGRLLLVATAQEALPDLVPRLTADRQILEWLRDRFRLRFGLEPTDVPTVVVRRLLAKTSDGAARLRQLYQAHQGRLLSNLRIHPNWSEGDFIDQYPYHPYAIPLVQDIMGAMRGTVEEARRLSGSQRSMLKITQAILTGEGEVLRGVDQRVGWLASLDLFYDALAPDLSIVRSDQVEAIHNLSPFGEVNGLAIQRVAKVLFLLQQLPSQRIPCTMENLAAALVDHVETDMNRLREALQACLQQLQREGWVTEEDDQFHFLTPAEHDLEREVRAHYPTPAQLKEGAVRLLREMMRGFRYAHGRIRRPLKVALRIDGQSVQEEGALAVELFTPLADEEAEQLLARSINEPHALFWVASDEARLRPALERALALERAVEQWGTRALTAQQEEHRSRLERELQTARQTRLPQLMKEALLRGRILLGGQRLAPDGNDIESVLHRRLGEIAAQVYTEFVDDRPDRDQDCAAILTWRPGMVLPEAYTRLGLVTSSNQINHDAGLLATVKAELVRRHQLGLPRTGRDLLTHFENPSYGWDPRLVRFLLATLFKAGLISVSYQNRRLADPTDSQARSVFGGDREFRRASFDLLPEVDWREASRLCSSLFGVQGGDTFERTASIVQEQAGRFAQRAENLAIRCQDNDLPRDLVTACREVSRILKEVAELSDPNTRLRRFLEHADSLSRQMPIIHRLREFAFDEYRRMRHFVRAVSDWARTLSGEAANRWERLQADLTASDLPERWEQLRSDGQFLWSRYRDDYKQAHRRFQGIVQRALETLEQHEAFQHAPDQAEQHRERLRASLCDAEDPAPSEETFHCAQCHRSWAELTDSAAESLCRSVESELDALLPESTVEAIEPLSLHHTIHQEAELTALFDRLRRYWRRVRRPLDVRVEARVREGDE